MHLWGQALREGSYRDLNDKVLRPYKQVCVCVCVLVSQSCPTVCDHMDCSLPGSSVHGISREEYWSGLPFPSPGDLPDPGSKPAWQADSLLSLLPGKPYQQMLMPKGKLSFHFCSYT